MKIFYDTEFLENGSTISLISIGMVAEDGREYYAVHSGMPVWRMRKSAWLMEYVVPGLPMGDPAPGAPRARDALDLLDYGHPSMKFSDAIARDVKEFIRATPDVELWAWYAAYDHVALCQLFGRMIDLPEGVPMWTNDLRQEVHRLGNPRMPKQESGWHNALDDARHNLKMYRHLEGLGA